jgi:uncharacterized protein with HEPN domain
MSSKQAKLLNDVVRACEAIQQFTAGRSRDDYAANLQMRSAVERQFAIVGEAIRKLEREDSSLAKRLSDWRRIIDFRNILVHGYDVLDDNVVWKAVTDQMPVLLGEARQLLAEIAGSKSAP